MSGFGAQCRKRLEELRKAGQDVPKIIDEAATAATIEAVATATKNTPPHGGASLAGTNTREARMSKSWATDSQTHAVNGKTILANNMQYASYVNDGHRMDKHFVPGLVIEGGMLQKKYGSDNGGIMVGTKTTYVPGLYMKEKAIGKYKTTVRIILQQKVRELLK